MLQLEKKLSFKELPSLFERFGFNNKVGSAFNAEAWPYMTDDGPAKEYELYVVQKGSLNNGHYYAYIKTSNW